MMTHLGLVALCAAAVGLLTIAIQHKVWQAIQHSREGFTRNTQSEFRSMFLFVDASIFWPACFVISILVGMLIGWWAGSILLGCLVMALCWLIPRVGLKWARLIRVRQFENQLPDALSSLASSLRSGASFSVALGSLLAYCPAPLSQEFGLIEREQRFGVTFSDALKHLQKRMQRQSVDKVVAAILISHQTGGELAQTLEVTARCLRAELHAQERLKALTAQGVMQAWVMALMPVGLALVMNQLEPGFLASLFQTAVGQKIVLCIVFLEILGLWWLRKINQIGQVN